MRDALAERLLAEVMAWEPEDIARERPSLQAIAVYKYDEYQQFSPGMRFVESLALWLSQFPNLDDRRVAYDFVRNRLIFCSFEEMVHLVSMAYPDFIRPLILRRAALAANIPETFIDRVARSIEYLQLRRQSLFLGLSDGAHIDVFRRNNNSELTHEQIWQTYDISQEKADDLLTELSKDLTLLMKRKVTKDTCYFQMVFLLDDFSGSGISCIRKEPDKGFAGKVAKLSQRLLDPGSDLSVLVRRDDLHVCLILYMATQKAIDHIHNHMEELLDGSKVACTIKAVQVLDHGVPLRDGPDSPFLRLVDDDSYYDKSVETDATEKGGCGVKRGFADCRLPLVLGHNTPNNSVFLLWANPNSYKVRGLFPRIERHRSES